MRLGTRHQLIMVCSIFLVAQIYAQTLWQVETSDEFQWSLKQVQKGDIIVLSKGRYKVDARLPANVAVQGAGCGQTILQLVAPLVMSDNTSISNVSIVTDGTAILAKGATAVSLDSIHISGRKATVGVALQSTTNVRIENCAFEKCATAIKMDQVSDGRIVNCTFDTISNAAISLTRCQTLTIFNNLISNATLTCRLTRSTDVAVNHNVYSPGFKGELDQAGPMTLQDWRSKTEQDSRSAVMPVVLKGFRVRNALDWHAGMASTSLWGAKRFNGVAAPENDLFGKTRDATTAVGALNPPRDKPVEAAGTFAITDDSAPTRVTLVDKRGTVIHTLVDGFHVPKGTYAFTLPKDLAAKHEAGEYRIEVDRAKEVIAADSSPAVEERVAEASPAKPDPLPVVKLKKIDPDEEKKQLELAKTYQAKMKAKSVKILKGFKAIYGSLNLGNRGGGGGYHHGLGELLKPAFKAMDLTLKVLDSLPDTKEHRAERKRAARQQRIDNQKAANYHGTVQSAILRYMDSLRSVEDKEVFLSMVSLENQRSVLETIKEGKRLSYGPLYKALRNSDDPNTMLMMLRFDFSTTRLEKCLKSKYCFLRGSALQCASTHPANSLSEVQKKTYFRSLADDPVWYVRQSVLRRTRDRDVIRYFLTDPNAKIQRYAYYRLDPNSNDEMDLIRKPYEAAEGELRQAYFDRINLSIPTLESNDKLREFLKDPVPEFRLVAYATLLCRAGPAEPLLQKMDQDDSAMIQEQAKQFRNDGALPVLPDLLTSNEIRKANKALIINQIENIKYLRKLAASLDTTHRDRIYLSTLINSRIGALMKQKKKVK